MNLLIWHNTLRLLSDVMFTSEIKALVSTIINVNIILLGTRGLIGAIKFLDICIFELLIL